MARARLSPGFGDAGVRLRRCRRRGGRGFGPSALAKARNRCCAPVAPSPQFRPLFRQVRRAIDRKCRGLPRTAGPRLPRSDADPVISGKHAVHTIGRYHDVNGAPVHLDVENFSQGIDPWLDDIPRLDEPVRLVKEDAFCADSGPYAKLPCGVSGLMLPHTSLTGKHGFDFPGQWIEQGRARCEDECTDEETEDNDDPCGCQNLEVFDIGTFIFHTLGRYLASGGAEWNVDLCNGTGDCGDMPEPLKWRDDPSSDAFNLDELK